MTLYDPLRLKTRKSARGKWDQELPGNLSAEAADETGRLTPDPLMGAAGGLPVPEDFLGVPSIQVDKAVSHEDGGKTDQERN